MMIVYCIHQSNENGQEMSKMEAIRKMQSHSETKGRITMYDENTSRPKKNVRHINRSKWIFVLYEIETATFFS